MSITASLSFSCLLVYIIEDLTQNCHFLKNSYCSSQMGHWGIVSILDQSSFTVVFLSLQLTPALLFSEELVEQLPPGALSNCLNLPSCISSWLLCTSSSFILEFNRSLCSRSILASCMISASEVGTIPFPVCGECTGSPLCWLEIFGPVLAEAEELLLPPELLTEEAWRCLYSSCKIVWKMKLLQGRRKVWKSRGRA